MLILVLNYCKHEFYIFILQQLVTLIRLLEIYKKIGL